MASVKENPLALWDQVCKTDPKHTKKVDMRGGFTAIDPVSQLHTATGLFGSYGNGWGLKDLDWQHMEANQKPVLVLCATFYYPGGEFPIATDMPYRANDDCYKKLLTAARSKSLSLLGFNADVFLGQYDDERYVQEMRTKFSDQDELRATMLKAIATAPNSTVLEKCRDRVEALFTGGSINKTLFNECIEAIDKWDAPANGQPSEEEQERIRQQEVEGQ